MEHSDRAQYRGGEPSGEPAPVRESQLLASASGTLGSSIAVYAALLVAGMLLSRGLGPVGRGELAAVLLWGSTAFDIGALGTTQAVAFFAASSRDGDTNPGMVIMRRAYPVLAALAVGVFLAIVVGSGDGVAPSAGVILATIAWIPLLLAFGLVSKNAQGHGRMGLFNVARLVSGVGPAAGIAVLAALSVLSVQSAVIVYALGLAAATAMVVARSGGVDGGRTVVVTAIERKRFWGYSLWSAASVLAVKGNRTFDLLMLSFLGAAADIGFYTVAATSALTVAIIGESLGMHAFERIVREPGADTRRSLIRRYLLATLGLSIAAGAVFWLLAPTLLPFVYGTDFTPSVAPARILIVGGVAVSASRLLGTTLSALGLPRAVAVSETIGAMVTLVGLLVWGVDVLSVVAGVAVAGYAVTALVELLLIAHALRSGLVDGNT